MSNTSLPSQVQYSLSEKSASLNTNTLEQLNLCTGTGDEDAPAITVEHLLTMSSGLCQDDALGDRLLDATDAELERSILIVTPFARSLSTPASCLRCVCQYPPRLVSEQQLLMASVPGTVYEYSNLGYALAGLVIARVSGVSYQQYITDHILAPLGMHDSTFNASTIPVEKTAQGYRFDKSSCQHVMESSLNDGNV